MLSFSARTCKTMDALRADDGVREAPTIVGLRRHNEDRILRYATMHSQTMATLRTKANQLADAATTIARSES